MEEIDLSQLKRQIGLRLKYLREKAGFTSQEALAKASGVSRELIAAIEVGNSFPSFQNAIRLANALEVSTDALHTDHLTTELMESASIDPRLQASANRLSTEARKKLIEFLEAL